MAIHFNFPASTTLRNRTDLKQFIVTIFKKEGKKAGHINYVFCSDEHMLQVNRSFLNHDYYTDIITFDLSQPGSGMVDAEIYISIDTVKSNAALFGNSIERELHRVIFHGVLHLCGYKDKKKADQLIMRSKEDLYLGLYLG